MSRGGYAVWAVLARIAGVIARAWATSNPQHTDDSAQSRRDGADNCLICQFVAQGQLLAEVFTATSFDQMNELVPPVAALSHPVSVPLPSFPRAPPFADFTLS